jgi:hypothetical protein
MKATLIKILVIAIAVTGMGCYVWNANRKQQDADKESTTPAMTPSPMETKSKPLSGKPLEVTDQEVQASRNAMMRSSKFGGAISEEDVRDMLENQKRKELQQNANNLAPSSKSRVLINPQEIKQVIEGESVKPSEP